MPHSEGSANQIPSDKPQPTGVSGPDPVQAPDAPLASQLGGLSAPPVPPFLVPGQIFTQGPRIITPPELLTPEAPTTEPVNQLPSNGPNSSAHTKSDIEQLPPPQQYPNNQITPPAVPNGPTPSNRGAAGPSLKPTTFIRGNITYQGPEQHANQILTDTEKIFTELGHAWLGVNLAMPSIVVNWKLTGGPLQGSATPTKLPDGKTKVAINLTGRPGEVATILRHEVMHAVAWSVLGTFNPIFMNEGMACSVESPERKQELFKLLRNAQLEGDKIPTIEELWSLNEIPKGEKGRIVYAVGLALIEELIASGPGKTREQNQQHLFNYLLAARNHLPAVKNRGGEFAAHNELLPKFYRFNSLKDFLNQAMKNNTDIW